MATLLSLHAVPFALPFTEKAATCVVVEAVEVVAESTRLRVVTLLAHGDSELSKLTRSLGQSHPRVSRRYLVCADSGLVDSAAEGGRLRRPPLADPVRSFLPAEDPLLPTDRTRSELLRRDRTPVFEPLFQARVSDWESTCALHVGGHEVVVLQWRLIGPAPVEDLLAVGTRIGHMLAVLADCATGAIGFDRAAAVLAATRTAIAWPAFRHSQFSLGEMEQHPPARQRSASPSTRRVPFVRSTALCALRAAC